MKRRASKAEATKEKLIASLLEARRCILSAASSLPAEKQDEVFLGVWSVKDLLAHLVGWDFTNLQAVQEILADRLPSFYARYDHDWQSYNAELVARYKKEDFAELLQAVVESHQALIAFLRTVPAEEFTKDRGLRAGRYRVTVADLLSVEARDEQEHCAQIRRFARGVGAVEE